jgi:hypothetical protein
MDLRDWRNALGWGLTGFGSHIEPLRAVKGLDVGGAAQVPAGGLHSAHEESHGQLASAQGLADGTEGGESVHRLTGQGRLPPAVCWVDHIASPWRPARCRSQAKPSRPVALPG